MSLEELEEVHVQSLTGLGASYRMSGFFSLRSDGKLVKVNFKGVAFGGHYGGHNVSVEISPRAKQKIMTLKRFQNEKAIE